MLGKQVFEGRDGVDFDGVVLTVDEEGDSPQVLGKYFLAERQEKVPDFGEILFLDASAQLKDKEEVGLADQQFRYVLGEAHGGVDGPVLFIDLADFQIYIYFLLLLHGWV